MTAYPLLLLLPPLFAYSHMSLVINFSIVDQHIFAHCLAWWVAGWEQTTQPTQARKF